jgi:hypothetical protein
VSLNKTLGIVVVGKKDEEIPAHRRKAQGLVSPRSWKAPASHVSQVRPREAGALAWPFS